MIRTNVRAHFESPTGMVVATPRYYETADTSRGAPEGLYTTIEYETEYRGYREEAFEGPMPLTGRRFEIMTESYKGRVVDIFSVEERVMSDVWDMVRYARVLADNGDFIAVGVGGAEVTVDASPEMFARWEEWKTLKAAWDKRTAAREAVKRAKAEAKAEAATPRKGKTAKVVKGRKVPKGTTGTIIWYGAGAKYGYYGATPMRVGLKTEDGTVHWTAASNVEVVS